jgi:hypothetical protein
LAALLLSGAGAYSLALLNFSFIVLFFLVAIIFFGLTLGPSPKEREAKPWFYKLTLVIKHFMHQFISVQISIPPSPLQSSPYPPPSGEIEGGLINRKIICRLVNPCSFFFQLHQYIVCQTTGAKPEPFIVHPVFAQCFIEHYQVVQGQFAF